MSDKKPNNSSQAVNLSLPALPPWPSIALAVIAGLILPLAYAPFGYALLAPVGWAVLAYLAWLHQRIGFQLGLAFGLGFYGFGISWVSVSMHRYGNMGLIEAGIATFVWVLVFAFFAAMSLWSAGKIRHKLAIGQIWFLLLVLPTCWLFFEWLRSWILTGFPWLLFGASQISSPLAGWMPIFGEYGAGFMMSVFGSLIVLVASKQLRIKIIACGALAAIWLVSGAINQIAWSAPTGKNLKVALVQGNISIFDKWHSSKFGGNLDIYMQESSKTADVDLVVWPEGAITKLYSEAGDVLRQARAQMPNSDFISGIFFDNPNGTFYNSMVHAGALGDAFYHKRHLVPFGEYTPLADGIIGWLMASFSIPMSNLTPSKNEPTWFDVKGQKIAPSICYEIIFADLIRADAGQANLLLTVSEDAWFGRSLAPEQHLEIAQVRAKENAKPIIRVTNNGITAAIRPDGTIQARLGVDVVDTLRVAVDTFVGDTFYGRYGNGPLFSLLILVWMAMLYAQYRKRTQ